MIILRPSDTKRSRQSSSTAGADSGNFLPRFRSYVQDFGDAAVASKERPRAMNMFPRDVYAATDEIVGGGQTADVHRCAETLERLRNGTLPLVDIDDDDRGPGRGVECDVSRVSATVGRFGLAEMAVG